MSENHRPQHGCVAKCFGPGTNAQDDPRCRRDVKPPSRVTHFDKRFCSEKCRRKWALKRCQADSITVRKYVFHYFKFHKHPEAWHAAQFEAPCTAEYGHERAMESLRALCNDRRESHMCPDRGADESPVNGVRLSIDAQLGPQLRDSELGGRDDEETRFFANALAAVQDMLLRGKCTDIQYDLRVLRRETGFDAQGNPKPDLLAMKYQRSDKDLPPSEQPKYTPPDEETPQKQKRRPGRPSRAERRFRAGRGEPPEGGVIVDTPSPAPEAQYLKPENRTEPIPPGYVIPDNER